MLMPDTDFFAHSTAVIDAPCRIGKGTRIWHYSHVMSNSIVGEDCNIGQNVVISPNCVIGRGVKIQNNVSVYSGVTIEDDVFLGPSMVFTNVINPRAFIERKAEYRPTVVGQGCTVGANATIVCGTHLGRYAMIGAGAVVTRDVPDYGLVMGNPARLRGWVCWCGTTVAHELPAQVVDVQCPACARRYHASASALVERSDHGGG